MQYTVAASPLPGLGYKHNYHKHMGTCHLPAFLALITVYNMKNSLCFLA